MNGKVLGGIVFAVVTGGLVFLCANAHIDFFPCEKAERDRNYGGGYGMGEPPIRKSEGTCSFMAHNRPERDGEYERFTGAGWAVFIAFVTGVGAVTGFGAGKMFGKKDKAES